MLIKQLSEIDWLFCRIEIQCHLQHSVALEIPTYMTREFE
jgi:hypothetical protein